VAEFPVLPLGECVLPPELEVVAPPPRPGDEGRESGGSTTCTGGGGSAGGGGSGTGGGAGGGFGGGGKIGGGGGSGGTVTVGRVIVGSAGRSAPADVTQPARSPAIRSVSRNERRRRDLTVSRTREEPQRFRGA